MLLQGSFTKIITCMVLLLLLAACNQSPTGGVVIQQEPEGPKNVIVTSLPEPAPIAAAPVPTQPVQPPQWIPENVLPQDEPEVIIIPESKPAEDPVAACIDKCEATCATNAARACSQSTGSACKQSCGQYIDPSACSTACSLRDAHRCEPKFIEFCTATCEDACH